MFKIDLELESADETMLADDADIDAFEREQMILSESRGTLVPYGWDCV